MCRATQKRATNGSTKLPFQRFGLHNLDQFLLYPLVTLVHLQIIFLGVSDFKNDIVPASMDLEDEEENEHDVPDFVGEDELYQ